MTSRLLKTLARWFVALLLVLPLGGCQKVRQRGAVRADSSAPASSAAVEAGENEDEALGAKLNIYVKCINSHSRHVRSARRRYTSWIKDPAVGPTCKERNIGVDALPPTFNECIGEVARAAEMRPKLARLEAAGADYAKALQTLGSLLRRASRYYDSAGYKQDGCRRGRKWHPRLLAGWEAFREAELAMRSELDRVNADLQRREIAATLKKHGKGLRYFKQKVIMDARLALDAARTQSRAPTSDLAVLKRAVLRYESTTEGMEDAVATGKEAASKIQLWAPFQLAALAYLESLERFVRRCEGKKKFSRFELKQIASGHGWMVKGSFANVLREHNNMVRAANSVRFL